jgi:anti-sigma-K factor RskA
MIPDNPDDLHMLAGEYVLGVLDESEASEVAGALASNIELRRAVTFWEEQLYPLSELAAPAEPPFGTWEAIEARITRPAPKPRASRFWENVVLWRWSTAGFATAAAALALWILVAPAPGPSLIAVLHPPQQDQASWIATAGRSGLVVRALAAAAPPNDRAFELWAIAPGAKRPRSLGVIPPDGELRLGAAARTERRRYTRDQHRALGGSPTSSQPDR